MSQCIVPNWNLRNRRQVEEEEEEGGGDERNRCSHVHTQLQNHTPHVPMCSYEVAELTWENGQLAMHGLGGLFPTAPTKAAWGRPSDTLESIVHQATNQNPANVSSTTASSAGKRAETSGCAQITPGFVKKGTRPESDQCGRNFSSSVEEECASASATFCKENDTNMMRSRASFESTRSLKTKTTEEEYSFHGGSENLDDQEQETKGGSHSTRRSRVAAVHNQSERRRRDRINQKMKALQKLVPNANKTDKASMLDEVIEYLKQLQAQIQVMSARNMPQMVMPTMGMQQQIQMSLLARMGWDCRMGIATWGSGAAPQSLPQLLHPPLVAAAAPTFVPPPFVVTPMIPNLTQAQPAPDAAFNNVSSFHFNNSYCAFQGQPMNMDLYNKMAAIYQQQVNQTTQPPSNPFLLSSYAQGG